MTLPMPTDSLGRVTSSGTTVVSFSVVGDNTFKPVTVPSECKSLLLVARDDLVTYTHIESPVEFHISSFANGTDWMPVSGINVPVTKAGGATVCYVRSAVGIRVVGFGVA